VLQNTGSILDQHGAPFFETKGWRKAQTDKIHVFLMHQNAIPAPLTHWMELDRRWSGYESTPGIALSREQFCAQITAGKKRTTK
jgi:hypothetical protein